ncbi:lipoprotein signal peptidase [Nocardioides dokdonensis FR1436]|uniref:Lipoprotein signal peptidase n=1 Tax=Nocardioides dokdonensis FR1436 TaxID=1300347 RepID=A0A1A9GLK8_9ACTN|nr:signal peptidase II [Nocardioides dokdonensis]ANH39158.1 lipoprotein signal peptidase [Nocardioides dokdonensis FR1436]
MQAARGAAVDPAATPDDRPSRRRTWSLFTLVALVVYAIDLGTKVLAVDRLSGEPDVPLVGDLLVLRLVKNPGAAFSTGTEYTVVLSVLSIVAACVVVVLSLRLRSRLWALGLGLLMAGVLGNLTDRIFRAPGPMRGHVIDFLMLPNWPVFNVADMAINGAAALILVQAFRGIRLDGTREGEHEHKTKKNTKEHE